MATAPELISGPVRLVPFGERHLTGRYLGWLNDQGLMRYSEQRHRTHTLASCRVYWQSFVDSPHYLWALEETAEGLGHIGNLNAYLDPPNGLADLGILIGEIRGRGKGLGLIAWRLAVEFLFRHTATRKISAGTMALNAPMLRLMERSGMIADGRRRRHYLVAGQETDIVHMALFREQWPAANGDGVAKRPIYCGAWRFGSFGIPSVWPHSPNTPRALYIGPFA